MRHRVERSADDVPIARHQALKVLGQLRGAQFEPHEKRRGRTHPRSVVHNRTWTACRAWLPCFARRVVLPARALDATGADEGCAPRARERLLETSNNDRKK